jgi:hypothetical protein
MDGPGLCDDDVIEGSFFAPEARETDSDDHFWLVFGVWSTWKSVEVGSWSLGCTIGERGRETFLMGRDGTRI